MFRLELSTRFSSTESAGRTVDRRMATAISLLGDVLGGPTVNPAVRPRKPLEETFKTLPQPEMADAIFAEADALYHPQIPREKLAENAGRLAMAAKVYCLPRAQTVLVKEEFVTSPLGRVSLVPALVHDLGHNLGGQIRLRQRPSQIEGVFDRDLFAEATREAMSQYGIPPESPLEFGRVGFSVFSYAPGQGWLGKAEPTIGLEEIRADLFAQYFRAHLDAFCFTMSLQEAFVGAEQDCRDAGDEYLYQLFLYGQSLGWEKVIRPVAKAHLPNFIRLGNKANGEERNSSWLAELVRLEQERQKKACGQAN